MKNKVKYIILITLLVLITLIIYFLKIEGLENFDNTIYNFISIFINEYITKFMIFITNFGDYLYITILIIILFIFIKNKWIGILITINSINSTIINKILKSIFVRPRPNILRLIKQGGYSFPSGHAMACMSFYGLLIYLIYNSNFKTKSKVILIIFLSLLILLIGISRIYLGVHYPSDVIAGYIISIIYLIIFISIVNKLKESK